LVHIRDFRRVSLNISRHPAGRATVLARRMAIAALALTVFGSAGEDAVRAADWPERPITIIVPYAAGGSMDVAARLYAKELAPRLGQPVVVEDRPGANGQIGMTYVAKAHPDGYTLVIGGSGPVTLNKLLRKSLSYDPDTQFSPIVLTTEVPQVLVVNPKLPVKNLDDLIKYAHSKKKGLAVGDGGIGGIEYLTALLFLAKANLKGVLINYQGTAPLVADLLGGHIDAGLPSYFPLVSSLHMLNVAAVARVPYLANVPTFREAGLDVVAATWNGIMGPAGMPSDIVMKINRAMNDALKAGPVRKEFSDLGAQALGGSPQDFNERMKREKALWSPIISANRISLN
jgi:tripartite-type tricarboxylate transporter receptor subunit TctC